MLNVSRGIKKFAESYFKTQVQLSLNNFRTSANQ